MKLEGPEYIAFPIEELKAKIPPIAAKVVNKF